MRKSSHPLPPVLLMLSLPIVASCASSPPVPVVSRCPQPADPPPSLMQPPQATQSLTELQRILQSWLDGASQTPGR